MPLTELERDENKDVLIVILARSQSKRIPNKNIKKLGGKPLIEWTIDCAKQIVDETRILVSTDGIEIRDLALQNGVVAPWLRPPELSLDSTSSLESLMHAVKWYSENLFTPKVVILLQPTSPFRSAASVIQALKLHRNYSDSSVLGVSKCKSSAKDLYRIENGVLVRIVPDVWETATVQADTYEVNGAIYVISAQSLIEQGEMYTNRVLPFEIQSRIESIDIDTEMDWELAQIVADYLKLRTNN
jgi:CMP-N,N'-diacetyllegionaminic acid synthase